MLIFVTFLKNILVCNVQVLMFNLIEYIFKKFFLLLLNNS